METRRNTFGRGCFLVGLAVLYLLLGMKIHIAWRDGLWPSWPLGDYLPDAVVRGVFAVEPLSVRSALVWLLSRDILGVVAAICLLVWALGLFGNEGGSADGRPGEVSR